jgi:hypothetical protein
MIGTPSAGSGKSSWGVIVVDALVTTGFESLRESS